MYIPLLPIIIYLLKCSYEYNFLRENVGGPAFFSQLY